MKQRRDARMSVSDMDVEFWDEYGISTGILKNVSRFGVCITDISRTLQAKDGLLPALISGKGFMVMLKLKEKWIKKEGTAMVMGAKLYNVPLVWTEMVKYLESGNEAELATAS